MQYTCIITIENKKKSYWRKIKCTIGNHRLSQLLFIARIYLMYTLPRGNANERFRFHTNGSSANESEVEKGNCRMIGQWAREALSAESSGCSGCRRAKYDVEARQVLERGRYGYDVPNRPPRSTGEWQEFIPFRKVTRPGAARCSTYELSAWINS